MGAQKVWVRERLMPPLDKQRVGEPRRDEGDDRLTVRQAILVWLIAAATGWLLTVGIVYLAARVF